MGQRQTDARSNHEITDMRPIATLGCPVFRIYSLKNVEPYFSEEGRVPLEGFVHYKCIFLKIPSDRAVLLWTDDKLPTLYASDSIPATKNLKLLDETLDLLNLQHDTGERLVPTDQIGKHWPLRMLWNIMESRLLATQKIIAMNLGFSAAKIISAPAPEPPDRSHAGLPPLAAPPDLMQAYLIA
jgi:hypothetical protein